MHAIHYYLDNSKHTVKKTTVLFFFFLNKEFFLFGFAFSGFPPLFYYFCYVSTACSWLHQIRKTSDQNKTTKKIPSHMHLFFHNSIKNRFPRPPPFLFLMYSSPLHSKKYILNLLKFIYKSNDFCCFYHRTLQHQWCSLCVVKGFLTISSQVLRISMDEDSTTYLGNLFQGLITLTVKKINLLYTNNTLILFRCQFHTQETVSKIFCYKWALFYKSQTLALEKDLKKIKTNPLECIKEL